MLRYSQQKVERRLWMFSQGLSSTMTDTFVSIAVLTSVALVTLA